jgi:ligand-binding sensor domain-containing protein
MFKTKIFFIYILCLNTTCLLAQMPGDKVLSIFIDEFDHQWFGTDQGLLRKYGDVWKAYYTQPGSPGIVNDLKQQNAKLPELWIATNAGIVKVTYSFVNISHSIFYNRSATSFNSDSINSITFDDKNIGYFSTPKGIGIFANSIWKFYTRLIDVLKNEFTTSVAKGDTIYCGTNGEGVARINKYVDGFSGASSYVKPWSSLPGDTITAIFIDLHGNQWYGTSSGISRHTSIEAKEGWDFYLTDKLPDKHVTVIKGDAQGNIWIGTRGGLARVNIELNKITVWTMTDGLPSDVINTIAIDKDQSVWLGTDNGASHFNGFSFLNIKTSVYAKDFIDL